MEDLKNTVDNDLLAKVDEILSGKKTMDDVPELVFSEEIPKDYDISADIKAESINAASINAAQAAEGGFEPDVDIPDAGFDYNAPEAPDFGTFAGASQQEIPRQEMAQDDRPSWNELKEKRNVKKNDGDFSYETKAKIGFGIGLVSVIVALFGLALGIVPVAIGIYYSISGRKGTKKKLATAGLIMCVIGALLWCVAVFGGGLLG